MGYSGIVGWDYGYAARLEWHGWDNWVGEGWSGNEHMVTLLDGKVDKKIDGDMVVLLDGREVDGDAWEWMVTQWQYRMRRGNTVDNNKVNGDMGTKERWEHGANGRENSNAADRKYPG